MTADVWALERARGAPPFEGALKLEWCMMPGSGQCDDEAVDSASCYFDEPDDSGCHATRLNMSRVLKQGSDEHGRVVVKDELVFSVLLRRLRPDGRRDRTPANPRLTASPLLSWWAYRHVDLSLWGWEGFPSRRLPTVEGNACATLRGSTRCRKPAEHSGSRRGHDTELEPAELAEAALAALQAHIAAQPAGAWATLRALTTAALRPLARAYACLAVWSLAVEPLLRRWSGRQPTRLTRLWRSQSTIWRGLFFLPRVLTKLLLQAGRQLLRWALRDRKAGLRRRLEREAAKQQAQQAQRARPPQPPQQQQPRGQRGNKQQQQQPQQQQPQQVAGAMRRRRGSGRLSQASEAGSMSRSSSVATSAAGDTAGAAPAEAEPTAQLSRFARIDARETISSEQNAPPADVGDAAVATPSAAEQEPTSAGTLPTAQRLPAAAAQPAEEAAAAKLAAAADGAPAQEAHVEALLLPPAVHELLGAGSTAGGLPELDSLAPHDRAALDLLREEEEAQAAAARRALKKQQQKERQRLKREEEQQRKEAEQRRRHEEAAAAAADVAARARAAQRQAAQQALAEARAAEAVAAAAAARERQQHQQQPRRQQQQRESPMQQAAQQAAAAPHQPTAAFSSPEPAQLAAAAPSPGSPTRDEVERYLQLLLQPQQPTAAAPAAQLPLPLPAPLPLRPGSGTLAGAAGSASAGAAGDSVLTPEDECVVCLAAHRTVVLAPCGHRAVCGECAAVLLAPLRAGGQVLCPLCRTPVESAIPCVR